MKKAKLKLMRKEKSNIIQFIFSGIDIENAASTLTNIVSGILSIPFNQYIDISRNIVSGDEGSLEAINKAGVHGNNLFLYNNIITEINNDIKKNLLFYILN